MEFTLAKRIVEASLFTAPAPMTAGQLRALIGETTDLDAVINALRGDYADRGVHLEQTDARFAFRTAPDLASHLTVEREEERKLSKAALETLSIIAYHQPATRGDIEDLRGVAVARGTLDVLLELEWIAPQGRRDTPGRPIEWATTPQFLDHFALAGLDSLPGVHELRSAGLLTSGGPQIYGAQEDEHLHEDDETMEDEAAQDLRPEDLRPEDQTHNKSAPL